MNDELNKIREYVLILNDEISKRDKLVRLTDYDFGQYAVVHKIMDILSEKQTMKFLGE